MGPTELFRRSLWIGDEAIPIAGDKLIRMPAGLGIIHHEVISAEVTCCQNSLIRTKVPTTLSKVCPGEPYRVSSSFRFRRWEFKITPLSTASNPPPARLNQNPFHILHSSCLHTVISPLEIKRASPSPNRCPVIVVGRSQQLSPHKVAQGFPNPQ